MRTLLIRLAQLGATLLVTWFVADRAGLGLAEVRRLDLGGWEPQWIWVVGSSGLLLFGYMFGGWLWGHIVAGLGGPALATRDRVRLFMIANLSRYVPGKIWQIAALATLARPRGVDAATATAAAVLLQGISLASALLLGLTSLWTLADGAGWRWSVPVLILGVMGAGLAPPVFRRVTTTWFRVTNTSDVPDLAPGDAVRWLVLGLLNWGAYTLAFWGFVRGMGFEAAPLATSSAFAAAYAAGYLAVFAPAGLGVREASLLALLSPQLGAGVAGAVAVLGRAWTTGVEVVPAAAFWIRELARPLPATGPLPATDDAEGSPGG